MAGLIEELSRHHFPSPPATLAQLEAFEERVGWRLDPDLRAFYLHCNGADLFDRVDPAFRFYPLEELRRARVVMLQDDTDRSGPASWFALCELKDSNYVLLDVSHQEEGRYSLRDGYREAFPDPEYCQLIAPAFSAFLAGALRSGGRWFWLTE